MRAESSIDGVTLTAEVIPMGEDLCVVITGGDRPHVGCVTLAVPHPGISDPSLPSATVSTLNLRAHRDDLLAGPIAKSLSAVLGRPVAVVCGVHFECFSPELAAKVKQAEKELSREILKQLSR